MDEFPKDSTLLEDLKKIKKIENLKMSLMTRDQMIAYIVDQMEQIERKVPEMVEYVDYDFKDHYQGT